MRALVILCHPEPRSFNHAVAARVRSSLAAAGHEVLFHDLYAEGFDPVLTAGELRRGTSLEPLVQAHGNELELCEALVIVHPDWWGGPPAMLKGWIDRVFRPGLAYEHEGGEFERKRPRGLLAAKTVLVLATTDSDSGRAVEGFWREGVFPFCGIEKGQVLVLAGLRDAAASDRAAWLDRVEAAVPGRLAAG